MPTGLLALLDDVAALLIISAAILDDVPAQVAKTTGKVSGIVKGNLRLNKLRQWYANYNLSFF